MTSDRQRMNVLADAVEALTVAASRPAVLTVLCRFARELVGADGVCIVLREGEECVYACTNSARGPLWEGQRFPLVACISGWAMLQSRTAVVPDVFKDERIPHEVYRPTYVRSVVMVPVGRGERSAAVGAYWARTGAPGEVEVALLQTLARAAGGALERCDADEHLRASELRLRAVFSNTVVGFAVAGLDGHLIEANERLGAILGYANGELLGKSIFDFTHPADVSRNRDLLEALLRRECDHFHLQKRYLTGTGETVWVHNYVWLIKDTAGTPVQLAAAVIDITKEKDAQERLAQAQRLDSLGQLTGGIAHDFNNLLTVINGSAEAIAEQARLTNPELFELATVVHRAGERAAALTSRLLSFARRQALDPALLQPDEVLAGMESMLRRTLGEHIALTVKLGADKSLALVDQAELEAAVLNLCVNARDAMPRGGQLTIQTREVAANVLPLSELKTGRRYVALAVRDTGSGMAPEVQERAFEPFFSTRTKGAGTGLGLSMVYGFAKQSNGHVTLQSEPGQGTTVTLYLPVSADSVPARREGRAGTVGGAGERILLVEDDDAVRSHVRRALTSLGYQVDAAGNADEALALLSPDKHYDLLLTDLVMPGSMDGIGLARAARHIRPGLKVLYTTGYAGTRTEQARREIGMHILHKPYGRDALASTVRNALADADTVVAALGASET